MRLPFFRFPSPPVGRSAILACAVAISACSVNRPAKPAVLPPEEFQPTDMHSRTFAASEEETCEAARRALLSQGYTILSASPSMVSGRKGFQPEVESHLDIEFRVVCAVDHADGASAIAFMSAQQDRFAHKKSNNSASVGVAALGSVSLPLTASSDSLVKVGSETISNPKFYQVFFDLIQRHLTHSTGKKSP
jgi:hypothetical protein